MATDMIASLACVLVSRLMFNLRDPREHSVADRVTTATTAAVSSAPTSTMVLLHTLTNVEDIDEPSIYDTRNRQGGSFSDTIFFGDCEDI